MISATTVKAERVCTLSKLGCCPETREAGILSHSAIHRSPARPYAPANVARICLQMFSFGLACKPMPTYLARWVGSPVRRSFPTTQGGRGRGIQRSEGELPSLSSRAIFSRRKASSMRPSRRATSARATARSAVSGSRLRDGMDGGVGGIIGPRSPIRRHATLPPIRSGETAFKRLQGSALHPKGVVIPFSPHIQVSRGRLSSGGVRGEALVECGFRGGIRTHDPRIHTTSTFAAVPARDVRGLDCPFTVDRSP
jgi:hypothetical protein